MENNSNENIRVIETAQNNPQPIPKKTRGAAKIIALALCCSLAGGAAGAGGMQVLNRFRSVETTAEETGSSSEILVGKRDDNQLQAISVDTSKELTASEIYAANVNSTVGIRTSVTTNYFGYQTQAAAAGSGFVLTSDGYIVTNYHVVEDANDIKVTTYDDKTYDATLVGYDESNDIAVLKIDANDLTPVVLGDSDQMNVGDDVVAIGNPLGELTFSLTSGSVSALNRKITINNTAMNLIQTDTAINSGNSGGALFNSHGEVIGITNAKYSSSGSSSSASIENIGFAIPINSVSDIITSIINNGYIEKPYIGISCYTLSNDYRNTSTGSASGVVVQDIENGGPAEEAGIKSGDVITEVDGEKIASTSDLTSQLAGHKEGDVVTLSVYRGGEALKIEVTLGVRQQAALPESSSTSESQVMPDSQDGQGFPGGQSGQGYPSQGTQDQGNNIPGFPGQGSAGQSFPGQGNAEQSFPGQSNADQSFPGQGNEDQRH